MYNIKDINFLNSEVYKDFKKDYPSYGYLRVRAYSANEALPIENMNIIIKTTYKGNQILFYEGKTNKSGLIEKIELPAPKIVLDNLVIPEQIIYEIVANYPQENFTATYKVNMYENICVVQNINVPPRTLEVGAMWQ